MAVSKAQTILEKAELYPQDCLISEHWSQDFAPELRDAQRCLYS